MDLICVYACHHMGGCMTDVNVPNHATGDAVEGRQLVAEPLGLIDDRLIPIGPHVVGVVHVDLGQGDPFDDLPGIGVYGYCGSRLLLPIRFFVLGIDPDFTDAFDCFWWVLLDEGRIDGQGTQANWSRGPVSRTGTSGRVTFHSPVGLETRSWF